MLTVDFVAMLISGGWDKMAIALFVAGILCLLLGLVWIGQGTGYFPYPAASFMINEMPWAHRGTACVLIGVISIVISRLI
jgi:hypothetical protein